MRLDDAWTRNQEERAIEPDVVAAKLHSAPLIRCNELGKRSFLRALTASLAIQRRADESHEQRMSAARIRRELGVELTAEEPRMLRQFHHLDQVARRSAFCPRADR